MKVWIPLIVALVSFVIFYGLGYLTGRRLKRLRKAACRHHWRVLLEKYPTFIQDRWTCDKCGLTENFRHDQPPVPIITDICDMGHVHIAEVDEWEEWPETVGCD